MARVLHSASTRAWLLMKESNVSAFRSCTSEAEVTAAAPKRATTDWKRLRIVEETI